MSFSPLHCGICEAFSESDLIRIDDAHSLNKRLSTKKAVKTGSILACQVQW